MKIDIVTLFPEMFKGPFDSSIVKRAREKRYAEINIHNLRNWANDKHKTVDDRPFGGGVGMIIKVDVVDRAIKSLKDKDSDTKVVLLDAGGKKYTQREAKQLSKSGHIILIAGHYEGVDYRVHTHIADKVYSIGDYILTGGEIPAMVIVDSVVRLIPGVIVKSDATKFESFSLNSRFSLPTSHFPLLEYPQYTRPEKYLEWKVPKVLSSGNHKEIEKWRLEKSITKTKKVRPDLILQKNQK